MDNPENSSDRHELSKEEVRNLYLLCSKLYEQVITEEELATLDAQLENSSAARWHYLRYISLHNSILISSGKLKQVETEAMRQRVVEAVCEEEEQAVKPQGLSDEPKVLPLTQAKGSNFLSFVAFSVVSAAALMLLWTGGWLVSNEPSLNDMPGTIAQEETPAQERSPAIDRELIQVASISNLSSSAVWQCNDESSESSSVTQGAYVSQGDRLLLELGEIELTYQSGTKLVLIGPAEFSVESEGGMLVKGGLVASVTEAGHGFTINTPNGKVVDLGTEFGVAVDDFGTSEVSVFKGKVEAFPVTKASTQEKHELNKGESIQWDKEAVVSLAADIRRFTNNVYRLDGTERSSTPQAKIDLDFSQDAYNKHEWQTVGESSLANGKFVLSSSSDKMRPYLITGKQFDPSKGTLKVECDFQFKATKQGVTPSIAILTRCSNNRGVALWDEGLLESCVRSSYLIDHAMDSGTLSTGLKLEGNRELTDIAGSQFFNLTDDQTYKLILEDDGVNIKCTISLKESPWLSKSVTCRSLFRGKSNYIAFEGAVDGTTIIEKVKIIQQDLQDSTFDYSDFASTLLGKEDLETLYADALDSLIPSGQALVMKESFETDLNNHKFWETLGYAKIKNGQLQLGSENPKQHIDTWRARPYLLTKELFNPSESPVTIIGKVTFADNFRSGYGASFAVMTRSSKQRGDGPGWEYSILEKGLRSNFWPAAWEPDHCLEIHERPDENTITLLSKKELFINPAAKTYVFRVIDSKEKVSLTMIDPRSPGNSETIESVHHDRNATGTIGFESCWGSPVMLDDLHIYQAATKSVPAKSIPSN